MLTSFLVWPLLLAWLLPPWTYWADTLTIVGYAAVIALSSLTTTMLAMFFSVVCRRTSVAMITSYLVIILLFGMPLAVEQFADTFFADAPATSTIHQLTFTSPLAACFSLPLTLNRAPATAGATATAGAAGAAALPIEGDRLVFFGFLAFYTALNFLLFTTMHWLFNVRWRVRVAAHRGRHRAHRTLPSL